MICPLMKVGPQISNSTYTQMGFCKFVGSDLRVSLFEVLGGLQLKISFFAELFGFSFVVSRIRSLGCLRK